MDKVYNPREVEDRITLLENNGYFRAEVEPDKEPFTRFRRQTLLTAAHGSRLGRDLPGHFGALAAHAGLQRGLDSWYGPCWNCYSGQG